MAYAISLGREHKAELVFLHVIQIPVEKNGVLPTRRGIGGRLAFTTCRGTSPKGAASKVEIFVQTHFRANIPGVS